MRKKINFLVIIIVIIVFTLSAYDEVSAALGDIPPGVACDLLANIGLTTQGWQHYDNNSSRCKSPAMQFGSPKLFRNNLSYRVEGTSGTVKELILILNVNNLDEAAEAHRLFLQVTQRLLMMVRNEPMPDNMVKAILHGGTYFSLISDGINVTIKSSYWMMKSKTLDALISKGYELRFIIK